MALINIMSIAMAPNPRTAAIYYFITALFILLACFDTYFALPLNVIILITYQYYWFYLNFEIENENYFNFFFTSSEIFSISWASLFKSGAREEKVWSPTTRHTFTPVLENLPSVLPSMPQRLLDIFCNLNSIPCSVFRLVLIFHIMSQ